MVFWNKAEKVKIVLELIFVIQNKYMHWRR